MGLGFVRRTDKQSEDQADDRLSDQNEKASQSYRKLDVATQNLKSVVLTTQAQFALLFSNYKTLF